MSWINELGPWLGHSATSGTLILMFGALAVRYCREPIYRIRIIQWTFVACLLVPLVQQFGIQPAYSLNLWPRPSNAVEELRLAGLTPTTDVRLPARDTVDPNRLAQGDYLDATASSGMARGLSAGETSNMSPDPGAGSMDADSATTQQADLSMVAFWSRTLQTVYLSLVAILGCLWCVAFVRRRAITKDTWPASPEIREVLSSIAGKGANRVQLLVSPRVCSPVMWGCWRPTIVIPVAHANSPSCSQLRWGLAHEWSHVLHRDFHAHLLAGIAKFVCFYQPAYWWLRRELSLSQDFLADAFAARHGEATEEYAAFLVSIARGWQTTVSPVGLEMSDGRSSLMKRIRVLLQSPRPVLQTGRRLPATIIAALAVVMMVGLGSVRFSASAADTETPKETTKKPSEQGEQNVAGKRSQPAVEPITYTGRVIDRDSGAPVAGATVELKRELSRDPKTGKWILLEMTSHESDEDGQYSFTLPPEQVAESSLYLEVNAHHPDFQSKGWSGYSHSMIRTNLEKGDPPFYATIKLSRGEAITGVVKRPDGTPAGRIQIGTYSVGPSKEATRTFGRGAFQHAETDDGGRFRIVVATPGDGVLWIHPPDFAPQAHRIGDKRGDLGEFMLDEGITISGQVLDAKGNPVPNVAVNARRRGDGEEADEFLNSNAVANGIRGGTMTDGNGRFRMKPLPQGTYRTMIEQSVSDPSVPRGDWFARAKAELKDVFAPMQISIPADVNPEPVIIRALPHVVIRGRFFNSKGEPRASHSQHFFGRFNGEFVFTESTRPGNDGWFELRVPHGTTEAKINTMTNEHGALRWRLEGMEELTYGREIPLGTLEADVNGLEIVRYAAPILLVKAVDEAGNLVRDFRVSSSYAKPPLELDGVAGERRVYREGDVRFEEQADGRWRSNQLLPDAEVSIEAVKDGFECKPQAVSLKEKETRELTFVLKKAADKVASGESE